MLHLIYKLNRESVTREIKTLVTLFFYYPKTERKVENMRKGNKRLTFADREKIEKMLETGARVVEIAEAVGVHRVTIYNEMKRGGEPYRAEVAQRTI